MTKVDRSVNCEEAPQLIRKVKNYTKDSLIYIATNERNKSTLNTLKNAGFLLFDDLRKEVAKRSNVSSLNVVDILAVEASLMLEASSFLAWGVSEIDDVVQYERRQRGNSYCLAQEKISSVYELNWCAHVLKLFVVDLNAIIFPAATPALERKERSNNQGDTIGKMRNPLTNGTVVRYVVDSREKNGQEVFMQQ